VPLYKTAHNTKPVSEKSSQAAFAVCSLQALRNICGVQLYVKHQPSNQSTAGTISPHSTCLRRGWAGAFRGWLLCLLLALASPGLASAYPNIEGITHHSWGIAAGLTDQLILAIAQTPDGYLWLGTPHGLVRFNGFRFDPVGGNAEPTLEEFGVACILVARDGSLWAGSVGGGVTHLSAGTVTHYGVEQGLRELSVRALYQSADGSIWAGTDRGLFRLQSGQHFEMVREAGEQGIMSIVSDGGGGFWLGGMVLRHCVHGRFEAVKLPPLKLPVRALVVAPDGALWIGSYGSLLERQLDGSYRAAPDVHTDVRTLALNPSGGLWIGTIGAGVLLRQPDGRIVQALSASEPGAKAVRSLAHSSNGDLWVGTQEGLHRLSATGIDFVRVPHSAGADYSSLLLDRDGSVWLSSGSLTHWVNHVPHPVVLSQLPKVTIRSIFRERDGALWVGTMGDGVFRLMDGVIDLHTVSGLGSHSVTGFAEGPDGAIWIGTDDGLVRWAEHRLTAYSGRGQYSQGVGTVRSMAFGRGGSVWIVTPSGLYQFNHGLYTKPEATRQTAKIRIWSLHADPDGSLWIGAGTGLYLWRNGVLRHIRLPRLSNESQAVISILEDTKKRFLFALATTVYRISREDVERSVQSSGKPGSGGVAEVVLGAKPEIFAVAGETGAEIYSDLPQLAAADAEGGAWYASSQGLVHIGSQTVTRQEAAPPVVIERIVVDGVPAATQGPVILTSTLHNIAIEATPILMSGRTGLELRRRLIGLEDNWSTILPGSSSNYGKLPPGTYRFRVEADWGDGGAASAAEVVIVQRASIYRQSWFLGACCLGLALLVGLFYRLRLHQMRLRFQAVAEERNRMAREIHDTLLQGCIGAVALLEAVEISHDQAAAHASDGQQKRWRSTLAYVREQMTECIKEAREAIWNLRSSDAQKLLQEALRDVLERLTSRAQVSTSLEVEGELPRLVARAQHELVMAAREAILNALAHARPSAIDLRVHAGNGRISIRIRDDGQGFDVNSVDAGDGEHFGLTGMQDRMRKFGGVMTIESEPGRGTLVHLSLPLGAELVRSGLWAQ